MSVTPFRLSGNELVALLVSIVPEKTLWSSLRIMGLLSDVEGYEKISDSYPPSEEVVIRGTQSLIDRGLLHFVEGVAHANTEIEAIGLAFAQPEAVLTYQSISEEVEFTSVIVDTSSGYRVVLDFATGSSYEATLVHKEDSDITTFFSTIAAAIATAFKSYLFDIAYYTNSDDVLTAYVVCTPEAPDEALSSMSLERGGYWVVSADVPYTGDDIKVYQINGESEEIPIFRREFSSLPDALSNLKDRLLAEATESEDDYDESSVLI